MIVEQFNLPVVFSVIGMDLLSCYQIKKERSDPVEPAVPVFIRIGDNVLIKENTFRCGWIFPDTDNTIACLPKESVFFLVPNLGSKRLMAVVTIQLQCNGAGIW